jgi:hypothetical protein
MTLNKTKNALLADHARVVQHARLAAAPQFVPEKPPERRRLVLKDEVFATTGLTKNGALRLMRCAWFEDEIQTWMKNLPRNQDKRIEPRKAVAGK